MFGRVSGLSDCADSSLETVEKMTIRARQAVVVLMACPVACIQPCVGQVGRSNLAAAQAARN